MKSNSDAQSDEHYHAQNDASQKIDWEKWQRHGGIYPADPTQMARLSSPLYSGLQLDGNVNQKLVRRSQRHPNRWPKESGSESLLAS